MSEEESEKTCFVIGPIGDKGSEERKHSDRVFKNIIQPVVIDEYEYKTLSSNKISKPGSITIELINHLIDDFLVIADLTNYNPNVFYELAIRHAAHKPVIQLIKEGQPIPFDIADLRTIFINFDVDIIEERKRKLREQIQHLEENPKDYYTPISGAIIQKHLLKSGDELKESNAKIISMLEDIRSMIGKRTAPISSPIDSIKELDFNPDGTLRKGDNDFGQIDIEGDIPAD